MDDAAARAQLEDWFADEPWNPDRLLPALRPYYRPKGGDGITHWAMLKHPLVFQVPFMSWKMANDQYLAKQARVNELLDAGKWPEALVFFERPYRMRWLLDNQRDIAADALRAELPWVWLDTEFPHQYGYNRLVRLFRRVGFVSDKEGWKPKTATLRVYRGATVGWPLGISWTTNRAKAVWFAERLRRKGEQRVVQTGVVPTAWVLGAFFGRGESEVVLDPSSVHGLRATPVDGQPSTKVESVGT